MPKWTYQNKCFCGFGPCGACGQTRFFVYVMLCMLRCGVVCCVRRVIVHIFTARVRARNACAPRGFSVFRTGAAWIIEPSDVSACRRASRPRVRCEYWFLNAEASANDRHEHKKKQQQPTRALYCFFHCYYFLTQKPTKLNNSSRTPDRAEECE